MLAAEAAGIHFVLLRDYLHSYVDGLIGIEAETGRNTGDSSTATGDGEAPSLTGW
ncbi:hypothetical protein [Nocardia colli]|uniref:hypothetical protein n=1 Tax=Nocardia colli TaxID=2545717 RepID=UPI00168D0EA6|nr:hypothetical protein [Nocardia colli]